MANTVSVSRTNLKKRRQKLRQKRQVRMIQAIWRTFAVSGLLASLSWMVIQPTWVLKNPQEIIVSGNRLLSSQAIRSLLSLSYPQSLWRIEPSRMAQSLEQKSPIAEAVITRRLFPPALIIQVKERIPVAVAQIPQTSSNGNKKASVGLLDADGIWTPLEKYKSLNPTLQLPTLLVIGSPEQYRPYWPQVYQAVSQSPVKIISIDFQNPANLILKTELGQVDLGFPGSQLPEQIKVLAQMRRLPTQLNLSQMQYIDLKNPASPLVQMNLKTPAMKSRNH